MLDTMSVRVAVLLAFGAMGCKAGHSTISLTRFPEAFTVSRVSASGVDIEGRFSLFSDDTRSPTVRAAAADVAIDGTRIGNLRLAEEVQLAARQTSTALMNGRLDFAKVTYEVYRSLFNPDVSYTLAGEARLVYRGMRRTNTIEGAGRLAPPRRLSFSFSDDSGMELVRLNSARMEAAPSDRFPVGVTVSLTVVNPFKFPVRVVSAAYELRVGDAVFLSGATNRPLILQAGPNPVHFITSVQPVPGVVGVANRFVSGAPLGVTASGEATLEDSGRRIVVQMDRH